MQLLTVTEAAEVLGVSTRTVQRWSAPRPDGKPPRLPPVSEKSTYARLFQPHIVHRLAQTRQQ